MSKPLAFGMLGVFGYLFYRYSTNPDGVSLADDLTSSAETIGEYMSPADIPFGCVDPETGRDYTEAIKSAARSTGVPALLLAALIRQESGFKASIRNRSSGAMGLGQFMPATASEWFGSDWASAVYKPDRAIQTTAKYLAWLYRRHGTWRFSVAAYNWGTGNVSSKGLANLPQETRDYVRIVYDTWSTSLPA
jgi:soluble lytic murein transglycosylase-like protein